MAREPDGSVDFVYYAGQRDSDPAAQVRWRRFSANALEPSTVLRAPVTLELDRVSTGWPGDYIGATTGGGFFFASYSDNSSGRSHIVVSRVPLP